MRTRGSIYPNVAVNANIPRLNRYVMHNACQKNRKPYTQDIDIHIDIDTHYPRTVHDYLKATNKVRSAYPVIAIFLHNLDLLKAK